MSLSPEAEIYPTDVGTYGEMFCSLGGCVSVTQRDADPAKGEPESTIMIDIGDTKPMEAGNATEPVTVATVSQFRFAEFVLIAQHADPESVARHPEQYLQALLAGCPGQPAKRFGQNEATDFMTGVVGGGYNDAAGLELLEKQGYGLVPAGAGRLVLGRLAAA